MRATKQPDNQWTKRELKLLGKRPDPVVAEKTGRTLGAVRYMRRRLGVPAASITNSGTSAPEDWLVDWIHGGEASASGERVSETSALGLSAYFACIKNISEDIAKLPCGIYERLQPRGRNPRADHQVHEILHNQFCEEMSAMTGRETLMAHALGWHGGFAEIVRNGMGPAELYPLDPTAVQVMRTTDESKRLFYMVHNIPFEPRDIFHIHGLGYDGLTGYVLSRIAKDSVGNAIAAQKFAGSFFANGTTSTGVIKVPDAMSEAAFKHLRESFYERHSGAKNQQKPIILEEGAEWTATSTDPQKSQMLEVLQYGVEDICRLFRMPPHKIQHLLRSTFSNIEAQAIEYVVDCLLGWAVRWEQEIWRKLLLPQERKKLFAKHNFNMLLRGDAAARSTFYRELFNIGSMSVNDIRDHEDENPVEGGDTYFVNAALIPLEMAATGEHLQPKEPAKPAEDAPPDTDTADKPKPPQSMVEHKRDVMARIGAAHAKSLEDVIASVLRVEHDKVLRATKKPDFVSWAGTFYNDTHKNHVFGRLKPAIESLCTSLEAIAWN